MAIIASAVRPVYPRVGGGTGHQESAAIAACPPVYPRVGGGTPMLGPLAFLSLGLSPRGGDLVQNGRSRERRRSIPAWAGEPPLAITCDTPPTLGSIPAWAGEPTYPERWCVDAFGRSIPAWAGEPF